VPGRSYSMKRFLVEVSALREVEAEDHVAAYQQFKDFTNAGFKVSLIRELI